MAQAGIHGMVGMVIRKWAPQQDGLMLGIVLGNLLPDADNLAVAAATLANLPTEGLHRTFTHSIFSILVVVVASYSIGQVTKRPYLSNLGFGLGIGILMHILLDLLVWFNGVEILWPIPSWINFWDGVIPPTWFDQLMLSAEFLFLGLFFLWLDVTARQKNTDQDYTPRLRTWIWTQAVLFLVFTILAFALPKVFFIPYGVFYLISLGLAIGVTIRMRETVTGMTDYPHKTEIKASISRG